MNVELAYVNLETFITLRCGRTKYMKRKESECLKESSGGGGGQQTTQPTPVCVSKVYWSTATPTRDTLSVCECFPPTRAKPGA